MDTIELHDAVYGKDYEAAVNSMQLLQQSITQQEGIGFQSKEELEQWAHDNLLDNVVFSNSQHRFYNVSHKGELITPQTFLEYYENILYYYVISKGLYSRKLNERKAELLYKADDTITMATISYDGKYIYMYNGGIGSLTNLREKITPVIYVLEPSGNVVNTIELDSKKIRNMFYGDEKYLFFEYENKLAYIDKNSISGEFKIVTVD